MAVPRFWRNTRARYNLIASYCKNCSEIFFPPRKLCPKCRRRGMLEDRKLSGRGEIYSFTVIRSPAEGFENLSPYVMALIKLEEGCMLTAQIADAEPEEVKIGDKVEVVFRKISETGKEGVINYGYKFRIVKSDGSEET